MDDDIVGSETLDGLFEQDPSPLDRESPLFELAMNILVCDGSEEFAIIAGAHSDGKEGVE